jgi:hypothetical protein
MINLVSDDEGPPSTRVLATKRKATPPQQRSRKKSYLTSAQKRQDFILTMPVTHQC